MQIEHVSVSRIKLYNQCPFRYALRYDLPEEKRPIELKSMPLSKGSAMHNAIEDVLTLFRETDRWDTKLLQTRWEMYANKYGVDVKTIEDGKNALLMWSRRFEKPTNILDIERKWEYEIDGIPVVFIPDLVEEIYEDNKRILRITDWKSNAFPYSNDILENDLQAPFYLHEMKKQYPDYDKYKFRFDFVFLDKVIEYNMPEERWDEATEYLLEAYKTISDDKNPEPMPNTYCTYCPGATSMICPIAKRMIEAGQMDEKYLNELIDEIDNKLEHNDEDVLSRLVTRNIVIAGIDNILAGIKDGNRLKIKSIMEQRCEHSYKSDSYKISFNSSEKTTYRVLDVLKIIGNKPSVLEKVLDTKKGEIDKLIKNKDINERDAKFLDKHANKKITSPILRVYNSEKSKPKGKKDESKKKTDSFWG